MFYLDVRFKLLVYLKCICSALKSCRGWLLYILKCGGWWYCRVKLDKVEIFLEVWIMDRKDVWREDIDDLLWGKWREVEVKRMYVESRRYFLRLVDGMGEGFCWGGFFEGIWRGRYIVGFRIKWKRLSWSSCLIIGGEV